MEITDVKIRRLFPEGRLKALVSITVGGDLAVHDLKVIQGPERVFVAMPSRRSEDGRYRDILHPITPEARQRLEPGGAGSLLPGGGAAAGGRGSGTHAGGMRLSGAGSSRFLLFFIKPHPFSSPLIR